jgi:hypothetical protein
LNIGKDDFGCSSPFGGAHPRPLRFVWLHKVWLMLQTNGWLLQEAG